MNENVLMENPFILFDDLMEIDDKEAKYGANEIKAVMNSIINSNDYCQFISENYFNNPEKINKETEKYKKYLKRAQKGEFSKEKNDLIIYFLENMLSTIEDVKNFGGVFRKIPVRVTKVHPKAILPKYQTSGDAGADIYACEHTEIAPGEKKVVRTGIKVIIPGGYCIAIVPRSGLSLKESIRIANAPGTVDAGYRGEVGVIVHNEGTEVFKITEGMRIAQMKLMEVPKISWVEISNEDYDCFETGRGAGFGSSGI